MVHWKIKILWIIFRNVCFIDFNKHVKKILRTFSHNDGVEFTEL